MIERSSRAGTCSRVNALEERNAGSHTIGRSLRKPRPRKAKARDRMLLQQVKRSKKRKWRQHGVGRKATRATKEEKPREAKEEKEAKEDAAKAKARRDIT